MEEKYGRSLQSLKRDDGELNSNVFEESDTSSDSEEEDDDGILASGTLDEQFTATLTALRNKDPRVYDPRTAFYTSIEDHHTDSDVPKIREKPMYLNDYHRENLLTGNTNIDDALQIPLTYAQLQDDLKKSIVEEMHAGDDSSITSSNDENADGEFIVKKSSAKAFQDYNVRKNPIDSLDMQSVDKDPETYLSNFLSARAWVASAGSAFQPFESDDEEEDRRVEAFEEAYNLRFEDPKSSNDKIMSHARDTVTKYSVRRGSTNPRKRAREAEQAKNKAKRLEREQEKARLRKLQIGAAEFKIKKIKEAAGLRGEELYDEEWLKILDDNWNSRDWEAVMSRRFGDEYYAESELGNSETEQHARKKRSKKPKWGYDLDIKDLLPDFDDEKPPFSLSDGSASEAEDAGNVTGDSGAAQQSSLDEPTSKKFQYRQKRDAKQNRKKVEQLVEQKLGLDLALAGSSTKQSRFRYRETSPLTYGLTAQDILMASDSQLNQYAGLKKMATFRDADKKRKDKKKLCKKARLRQWRKETFGNEKGPEKSLKDVIEEQAFQKRIGSASQHGLAQGQRKRSTKNN